MPIIPWECALGDAPPVTLPVAATVAIAPPDDSVDTNKVIITGTGTINSFGVTPQLVSKDVTFVPTGGSITLVNSAQLVLLGAANRIMNGQCVGRYASDGAGHWTEIGLSSAAGSQLDSSAIYSATISRVAGSPNVSAVSTTADTVTIIGHGLTTGQQIYPAASWPSPVPNNNSWLYVRAINANTLALYGTLTDALADTNRINLTTTTTGGTWGKIQATNERATGLAQTLAKGGFAFVVAANIGFDFYLSQPVVNPTVQLSYSGLRAGGGNITGGGSPTPTPSTISGNLLRFLSTDLPVADTQTLTIIGGAGGQVTVAGFFQAGQHGGQGPFDVSLLVI